MPPAFRNANITDVKIAELVGLETYKALYFNWPELYSYINYTLEPTNYFLTLVNGVVASSGLSFDLAGTTIRTTLANISQGIEVSNQDYTLVESLIESSYKVKYLDNTPLENAIWILVTIFLAFFLVWYLYRIGFWSFILNEYDGVTCYSCTSIFDRFVFL